MPHTHTSRDSSSRRSEFCLVSDISYWSSNTNNMLETNSDSGSEFIQQIIDQAENIQSRVVPNLNTGL